MTKVVVGALGYAGLSVASRGWHRSWGTLAGESDGSFPGDELIAAVDVQTTRGIEIHAPPEQIWPWLLQMGQGRGGLYTYAWIENLLGAKIHNLDRLEPDLQHLSVGDHIRLTPETYLGGSQASTTGSRRFALSARWSMLQRLPTGGPNSWSFNPCRAGAERTRLVVRGRSSAPSGPAQRVARQVELLLLEPGYFMMERGMLRGLKKRAEQAARSST